MGKLKTRQNAVSCGNSDEEVPNRQKADGEWVQSKGNAWIVLGRDRPSCETGNEPGKHRTQPLGFGPSGDEKCAMVDLVAGLDALPPRDLLENEGVLRAHFAKLLGTADSPIGIAAGATSAVKSRINVHPSFHRDAARIYISQKAAIDEYLFKDPAGLSLKSGRRGKKPFQKFQPLVTYENPKSAISLKADDIRIVARENIKIVSHCDGGEAGHSRSPGPFESGSTITYKHGIDLIGGGPGHRSQPLVKGDNLADAFSDLVKHVDGAYGVLSGICAQILKLTVAVMFHDHVLETQFGGHVWKSWPAFVTSSGPFPGVIRPSRLGKEGQHILTLNMSRSLPSIAAAKYNLSAWENKYLTPGEHSILSSYNTTT